MGPRVGISVQVTGRSAQDQWVQLEFAGVFSDDWGSKTGQFFPEDLSLPQPIQESQRGSEFLELQCVS